MTAADAGPVECPHCGARVGLTRGICPACRRDATDLRDAAVHREQARLAAAVKELISRAKHRSVIRRVLRDRGEDAARVDGVWTYAWAAVAFGCMHTAWGLVQWRRSRRP